MHLRNSQKIVVAMHGDSVMSLS